MSFGIIFALLAAIFWGTYVVPTVKLKDNPFLIVSIIGTTVLIISLIIYGITSPGITTSIIFFGFIAGVLWSLAQIYYLIGLRKTKYGRYAPICSSFQILLNFFIGIIIFNELIGVGLTNLITAFTGIILLIIGVFLVSSLREKEKSELTKYGLFFASLAATLWPLQFISFRLANANPFSIMLPMGFGMAITAWVYTLLKDRKVSMTLSSLKMSSLSGGIWIIGNYLAFFAVNDIGLARGFSITQINNLVTVLWSIMYFKEFKEKKSISILILSVVIIILGATLMAFAKT
jgi:glucose uptake protein